MTPQDGATLDLRPGTYVLVLAVLRAARIRVGRLGEMRVRAGFYGYVGSAFGSGGLAARCGRHVRADKVVRWHIDYLGCCSEVREIWFSHDPLHREHQWAEILSRSQGARSVLPGFGASDCACPTHLFQFAAHPSFRGFARRVRQLCPRHHAVQCVCVDGVRAANGFGARLRMLNAPAPGCG